MALAALLREHGDAVEADLIRFYQIDVRDFWRGGISVRRLSSLINNLPRDSAVSLVVDPVSAGWQVTDYILAAIFDALQSANWQRAGNPRARHPEPFPRPADIAEQSAYEKEKAEFLERKAQEWRDRKAARKRKELTT